MIITRTAQAAKYEAAGINQYGIACLLRETAPARHKARVAAAIQTAKDYYLEAIGLDEYTLGTGPLQAGAAAILYTDVIGVGGKEDCQGASTQRHPALVGCGKGRKQASDGGAWSAAIREAACELAPDGRFVVDEDGVLIFHRPLWGWSVQVDETVAPLRWQYAIAREGLRRAAGLPKWHPHVPFHAPPESLTAWAEVLAKIANAIPATESVRAGYDNPSHVVE